MIDRKQVELLIRAQFQGKQTLDAVNKSLGEITGNLDKQTAAAKRGEAVIDELKGSYTALQDAQAKLGNTAQLVSAFQASAAKVQDLGVKVEAAKKKLADYTASLGDITKASDTQVNKLQSLQLAYERVEKRLATQVAQQTKLKDAIADAGLSVNDLAAAETKLRDAAVATGKAMATAEGAIKDYATNVRTARDANAALAADQAAFARAEKLADSQRAARAKAFADYEAAQAARTATTRDRQAEVTSNSRADADQQQAIKRQQELLALRKDIEERSATSARDTGLAKTADDAQNAARAYTTLARAATDLTPKVTSLRDAVNAILNPSNAARTTLAGVESEILKLGSAINSIKGPVTEYNTLFKSLVDSQKALTTQSGLIDNFRQQSTALRQARADFVAARAEVAQYAAAVRAGGDAGASFTKSLAESEVKARSAAQALQTQLGATRQARDALRNAGIATNDLTGAEQRLITATQATVSSTKQLTAAVDQYGEAAKRSGKGGGLFGDEGRTTLSFVQRLRGEILALAAAYTGLQGAVGLAQGAIDSTNQRTATKNILGVALNTTDKKEIDSEYAYVKGQADRLGLVYTEAAQQYAKFAVAAAKSGRSRTEIRALFESFAEGGRVLNLTTDQLQGVFVALGQSFSKAKLMSEELKGQLGERLPGVFEIAQKALQKQFPDLNKAMAEGRVGAEQLILVAEAYRKVVADQLPEATQSLAAQQARLTNAVDEFKLAVGDSGWTNAYADAVQRLTAFLKSDDGAKFAKSASTAFTLLAQLLVTLLENFDLLKLAAEGFLIIFAGKQLVSALTALKDLGAAAKGTAIDFKSAAGIASTALAVFQAALIGWEIGTYLREKFEFIRKAATYLVTGLDEAWQFIKFGFGVAFDTLPDIAESALGAVLNKITYFNRLYAGAFSKLARAAGLDEVANSLDKLAGGFKADSSKIDAAIAARKAQLKKDITQIEQIRAEMLQNDEDFGKQQPSSTTPASATPSPGLTGNGKTGPSEADIAKRERKIEEITKSLETLDAKIDRSQSKNLQAQLDAVDTQYEALKRKIDKLGGPEEAKFMQQLADLTGQYKTQIISKFNADLTKEQDQILSKLEAVDAAAGRKSKKELDDRLAAISLSYESTYRDIENYRKTLVDNGKDTKPADDDKARLDAGIVELKRLEQIKFATEELKRREADVNAELENRNKLLAAVKAQQDVGKIDDVQAAEQINQINQAAVPAIQAAVQATREWALANQAVFNNPEQQAAFISSLDAVLLKAQQVKTEFGTIGGAVINGAVGVINNGLNSVADHLQKVATGQESVKDGFIGMLQAFGQFVADFLREIAVAIIKLLIFNALKNSGNPVLAAVGTAGANSVSVQHSGGMVGSSNRSRRIDPSAWGANIPRYHSGGMPGLSSDEYATILQKGEEVLTGSDPRNIMNGGAAAGAATNTPARGVRTVLVDDRSKIPEAMNSPEGDAVNLQFIKRNVATLRSMLK